MNMTKGNTAPLTHAQIIEACQAAQLEARAACSAYFEKHKYCDHGACGFAWVYVAADGRSKLSKSLKAFGFAAHWQPGGVYWWSPGDYRGQGVDGHYVGACAAAAILRSHGIDAHPESRLD